MCDSGGCLGKSRQVEQWVYACECVSECVCVSVCVFLCVRPGHFERS